MFLLIKPTATVMALVLMTACAAPGTQVINEFRIENRIEVIVTPPRHQVPRGEVLWSCTSINAIRDYVDYGDVSRGCGYRAVTYIVASDNYWTRHGYSVTIMQYNINSWPYYAVRDR